MRNDIVYQNKAVSWLVEQSKYYLSRYDTKRDTIYYAVLQAITGSGKTVIASKYIEAMLPDSEEGLMDELAFIWLSVGSGSLHIQSTEKLKKYLPETTKIMMAEEAILNSRLNPGEILVLNWESLNTKVIDEETGKRVFDNIFMRDGDKPNLQTLWANTKSVGVKIALIIDESHNTAGSETSREIIDLIDPAFVIELTATPDFSNPNPKGDYEYHTIRPRDVIKEEVVKKNIKLNDTSELENTEGVLLNLISQAIEKREEIKKTYIDEGIDYINPLCLIQLPDGAEGDLLKENVIEIFNSKDINYSNKKLAIWLAEKENKINLENIEYNDSTVDYLIFKQAIATGWDCPRASVLVKLRDVQSETFDLQTIGRILRMPELKHYKNPILNESYIYTNAEYTLNTGGYTNVLPLRQLLKEKYKDDVLNLELISETISRQKLTISEKDLINMFKSIINLEKEQLTKEELKGKTITATNIDVNSFHKKSQTEISFEKTKEVFITYSKKDIDRIYKLFINKLKNDVLSYKFIDTLIINYFKEFYGDIELSRLKRKVLANEETIEEVFGKLKSEINKRRFYSVETQKIKFETDRHSNERNMISYKKCAYEKHFVSKYNTERTFEKYMEGKEDILYWIKNGDAGQTSLSIAYNDGKIDRGFFPDYIVKFKNGNIGLYEVKDINDRDKNTITPKKIRALEQYCNKYGYKGGLVEIEGELVHLSSMPEELRYN